MATCAEGVTWIDYRVITLRTPKYELDDSALPLIFNVFLKASEEEDYALMEEALFAALESAGRAVVITDIRELSMTDPKGRARSVEFEQKLSPYIEKHVVCSIIVIRAAVVRAVLTAIRWFSKPPAPEHYVSSLEEALDLARAKLQEQGLLNPIVEKKLAELRHHETARQSA